MTQKDEFDENSGIFWDSRESSMSIEAFKAFAKKHGAEQAKGYLQAIKDLHPIIRRIARGEKIGRGIGLLKGDAYFISPEDREEKAEELFSHVEEFLGLASSFEFIRDQNVKPGASFKDFSPD